MNSVECRKNFVTKMDDIFEAMRLINTDEIHEAFVEEFERLRDEVEIIK